MTTRRLSTEWVVGTAGLAIAGAVFSGNPYVLSIAILIVINAMLAQSINIVQGLAGQVSLAQAGFMALGAYGCAYLTQQQHWPFLAAAAAVLAAGLIAGLGVALVTVRFGELMHFAIATLAFATIFDDALGNWNFVGANSGYPVTFTLPKLGGIDPMTGSGLYWFGAIVLAVLLALQGGLMRSTLGRCFVAVRENGRLAKSLGISTARMRVLAFTLATIPAVIAGIMFAPALTYISPDDFAFTVLVAALLMTMVGGSGTLIGPLLGAAVYEVLPQVLQFSGQLSSGVFGLILVLLVLFTNRGLTGLIEDGFRWAVGRASAGPAGRTPAEPAEPAAAPLDTPELH